MINAINKSLSTALLCIYAIAAHCDNKTFAASKYDEELKAIKLPLIEIVTANGEEPAGAHVFAPDDLWGIGLVDNEYIVGHMRMTIGDSLLYDSGAEGMKIRVRGNSSSYYRHKKPYKIKLNKNKT